MLTSCRVPRVGEVERELDEEGERKKERMARPADLDVTRIEIGIYAPAF